MPPLTCGPRDLAASYGRADRDARGSLPVALAFRPGWKGTILSLAVRAAALAVGLGAPTAPAIADSMLDMLPTGTNPLDVARDAGLDLRLSLTQFYGALVSGDNPGNEYNWRYGGRGNLWSPSTPVSSVSGTA